jgi:hypothetical protein
MCTVMSGASNFTRERSSQASSIWEEELTKW